MESIAQLRAWVSESRAMVFFGGAGVSTESGIPDFRSVDGLYHQQYPYPPETILSATFFHQHTEEFYRFYREKMLCHSLIGKKHKFFDQLVGGTPFGDIHAYRGS